MPTIYMKKTAVGTLIGLTALLIATVIVTLRKVDIRKLIIDRGKANGQKTMAQSQSELSILHVTDLHCAYDKIQQLKEWLEKERLKIDLVLISGDIANVPQDQYHTASKELLKEHNDNLQRIAVDFVSVAEKVYFVGGNHDTMSHFEVTSSLPENVEFPFNVHSRKIQIAPHLSLLGLGGSVPAFCEGKELWEGFPYSTDEKFGKELSGLLDPVIEQGDVPPGESYIIMTHIGPAKTSTTEVHRPPDPVIVAGSDILYEYLTKKALQEHMVMNVHGHVHPSIGMASIGSIAIINPGALIEGNFGVYTLQLVPNRHPAWKLSCASLHRLEDQ